ncbi:MAG: hypothetical protein JSV02_09540 [Dehalococcoidia bacterium]|nr:MAG: hypothetical protein JSV02_09540 [Dehalococcoidia bacterium]
MEKWLLVVESNSNDPAREKEFNEWYDNVHLPDVLATPGIIRATRYANDNATEGQGKFLAFYEIETTDAPQVLADLNNGMVKWTEQGRITELLSIAGGGLYRQITTPVERK